MKKSRGASVADLAKHGLDNGNAHLEARQGQSLLDESRQSSIAPPGFIGRTLHRKTRDISKNRLKTTRHPMITEA
jgi:hypothetical protein